MLANHTPRIPAGLALPQITAENIISRRISSVQMSMTGTFPAFRDCMEQKGPPPALDKVGR
jgi:hypothetical protein